MNLFNNYIYGSNEFLGRLYLVVSSLIIFGLVTLYSISSDPLSINSSFKLFNKEHINIWDVRKKVGFLFKEMEERVKRGVSLYDLISSGFSGTFNSPATTVQIFSIVTWFIKSSPKISSITFFDKSASRARETPKILKKTPRITG